MFCLPGTHTGFEQEMTRSRCHRELGRCEGKGKGSMFFEMGTCPNIFLKSLNTHKYDLMLGVLIVLMLAATE